MWIQVSAHVCIDRRKVASMSKEAKHFTQYLRQEHPDCNKSLNRYIFSRRVSRNCMPFVRKKKNKPKNLVLLLSINAAICFMVFQQCSYMVVEATGEKAGRAKGERKCSQFIALCGCTVGAVMPWNAWMEGKPTLFPHIGEKRVVQSAGFS